MTWNESKHNVIGLVTSHVTAINTYHERGLSNGPSNGFPGLGSRPDPGGEFPELPLRHDFAL